MMASLSCQNCGTDMQMVREQESPDGMAAGVRLETYQCPRAACGRKAMVIFEPASGHTAESASFVETEVARTGAFFPSDYTGRSRMFR